MASLLTGTTIAANIALHAVNVATYALPIGGGTLTSTLSITGGDGLRVFRNGAASVSSQIYWANSANTIAYNWQIDENGNAGMWGYGGVGWAKVLTVTSGGAITATGADPVARHDWLAVGEGDRRAADRRVVEFEANREVAWGKAAEERDRREARGIEARLPLVAARPDRAVGLRAVEQYAAPWPRSECAGHRLAFGRS